MISVDSSVLISFLHGEDRPEVERLIQWLTEDRVALAPSTVTEMLSDPKGGDEACLLLSELAVVPIAEGFWERAGQLRASVRRTGAKAALGDALIAQNCLDADIPLLTRDADFEAFARVGGLKLV